ncbi:MAG: glycosyltransferase, partial [Patescibacteria group bacterium]
RSEIETTAPHDEALKYFKFESDLPVILILGGSQGAELINNTVIDALPRLLEKYQVIHQTGVLNFKTVEGQAEVVLHDDPNKARYFKVAFLNPLGIKMAAGAATVIVSRAGSTIFEIASWGVPSVLVPFKESNGGHALMNAFTYAHAGACTVIEEPNMTAGILVSEIASIIDDKARYEKMAASAKAFGKKDAALTIARAIVDTALSHER